MFSPSVSTTPFRDCIEPRPPTPPKDVSRALDDAISFLDDSHEVDRALTAKGITTFHQQGNTPEPSSSPRRAPDSSNAGSKRVDFSSTPIFHEPVRHFDSPVPHLQRRVRPILDSKSSKPLRSILKPGQIPLPPSPEELDTKLYYFSPEEAGSFAKMLQSVIRSLASPRQDQRLDAYLTLNGTLQKYDADEQIKAMAGKMNIMTQFIARDMAWKHESGSLDVNIVQQALKLTAAILSNPNRELVASLDSDFRALVIDRSIMMIETPGMPKAIVKLHLWLLSAQRFSPSILTDAKVSSIVTALQTIEQRVSGKTAVVTRLMVYKTLLEQCQEVMLRRTQDWFVQILHDLLSSAKDIRQRALDICTTAGLLLGADANFSKAVRRLFEMDLDEEAGQCYYEFFSLQLVEMYKSRDTAPYVPQIWAAIVLCFRSKAVPIGGWKRCRNWLMIIQKCLNSNDIVTKTQAVIAWNKFVFAVMPDSSSTLMLPMLRLPPASMFKKQNNDKLSKQTRELAMNIFCNLLHYTLRPGLSYEELDSAWDVCIRPVFNELLLWKGRGRLNTCYIMKGLLTSKPIVWNINIANEHNSESGGLMTPADVPHVDPRWVRSRLGRIIAVLEPILQDTMWAADEMSTETIDSAMAALFVTIAEASSQEIKTSNELKQAVSVLTNLFDRLWGLGIQNSESAEPSNFLNRYNDLLSNAVQYVRASVFAEDILVRTTENGLEAAVTPSSRPSKAQSVPHAPLVSLFGLLFHPPETFGLEPSTGAFSALALNILDLLTSTKVSPPAKLDLLSRSARIWNSLYCSNARTGVVRALWRCIAEHTIRILQDDHTKIERESSHKLGHELRYGQEILNAVLVHAASDEESLDAACSLLDAMLTTAKHQSGAGGAAIAIVEPLAKRLLEFERSMPVKHQLRLVTELLLTTSWPKTRQEVEESKLVLWNSTFGPQKRGLFEPFEDLSVLISTLSTRAYDTAESDSADLEDSFSRLLNALSAFLSSCPVALLPATLRKLQNGLAVWVEDKSQRALAGSDVSNSICKFWHKILASITTIQPKENNLLHALERLLIAGLSSPRKAIVNETITFWNRGFGSIDTLEYPEALEAVLRVRSAETEVLVSSLRPTGPDVELPILPSLYESQEDEGLVPSSADCSPEHRQTLSVVPGSAPADRTTRLLSFSPVPKLSTHSTPARRADRTSSAVSTPKARLMHDDSQIQFAHIDADSSPVRFEETQNLTEHQREVTERQRQDATLYPELSSSPIVRPRALPRSLQKRLAFISQDAAPAEPPLPPLEDPVDIGNILADEIPSSPTPSSARGSDYNKQQHDDEQAEDEHDIAMDPPSSPPRGEHDDSYAHEDAVMDVLTQHKADVEVNHTPRRGVDATTVIDETILFNEPMSDTPDDVRQLRMEEEAAHSQHASQQTQLRMAQPREIDEDVSKIEDSFVESQNSAAGLSSTTKSRKRKRKSKGLSSSKKRRSLEIPSVPSGPALDEDDDIGDEIIVAGSQNRPSPEPEDAELPDTEAAGETIAEPAKVPKRRSPKARRQARKSHESRGPSPPSALIEATLVSHVEGRQHLSALRPETPLESTALPEDDTTAVQNTSNVEESSDQIVQLTGSIKSSHEQMFKSRTLVAVVPTPPKRSAAVPNAPVTPSGLLNRLQDILTELPNVTLNALQDRQLRHVLNNLASGVYEARERGLEAESNE